MPKLSAVGASIGVEFVVGQREWAPEAPAGDGVDELDELTQAQRPIAAVRVAAELGPRGIQ